MRLKNQAIKIIIFIIIIVFLAINIFENTYLTIFQNNYTNSFINSVKQYNLSVTEFLTNLENAIDMLSQSEMIQYVSDNPEKYYDSTLNLLKTFNQAYSSTAFAYFAPENKIFGNKKLVSWPDTSEELSNTSWEAAERPWYINAINSKGKITWTKPYTDSTTNKDVITVSKVVFDKEHNFKGVMAIDIYLDELSNKINDFKKYNQGDMIIFSKTDTNNFFIIENNENKNWKDLFNDTVINNMYSTEAGTFFSNSNAGDYYISYETNSVTGWKVVGVIEKYQLTKETTDLLLNALLGIIALLLISIMGILYIKKQLGSTIRKLSGSIISIKVKARPSLSKINSFQTESEDIVLDKTTLEIKLLFKIEGEKERINHLTKNNSLFTMTNINELMLSIRKLADYKSTLDPSQKSHEIQFININEFLVEIQEYINALDHHSIPDELKAEIIHLNDLIKNVIQN